MEDLFIIYEQALALKELGFDEPCIGNYFHTKELKIYGGDISRIKNSDMGIVTAPLKQQVFKWFRDEHNTQSSIEWNKSDHVWFTFKIYFERLAIGENPPVMVGHTINSWLGLNLHFNTYEEAESACIDRLIEILKNKK